MDSRWLRTKEAIMDISVVLNFLILVALSVGGFLLVVGKGAIEAWVRASAEKGAEVAIKNINWPRELAQELEKARGLERQEVRFKSYAGLWAKQRPLAIYDTTVLDRSRTADLTKQLSDWYFSEAGGLMLTQHVRDFYFSLQDLLRTVATASEWKAERVTVEPRDVFRTLLEREGFHHAKQTLDSLDNLEPGEWQEAAKSLGKSWRMDVKKLAASWSRLNPGEQFAVLQQVASTLRTTMVNDVESRLP